MHTFSEEMDMVTRVQILDNSDCISHCANIVGNGMDSTILNQLCVNSWADWFL